MPAPNYLIGYGQRLVRPITLKRGGGNKAYPHTFEDARELLVPRWKDTAAAIAALPAAACPNGQAVIAIKLNPAFLARTYYPANFLRDLDLRHMGSRVAPAHRQSFSNPAPEIFVAGDRKAMGTFSQRLAAWDPPAIVQNDFRKIDDVRSLDASRIRPISKDDEEPPLEVVLHASEDKEDDYILKGFEAFVTRLGMKVDLSQRIHAGGLCFLTMRGHRENLQRLAEFSFVRTIRRMPRLSLNDSLLRTADTPATFRATLPGTPVVNNQLSVAIFDGGLPSEQNALAQWARALDADGVGPTTQQLSAHGLGVTSALLFGSLSNKTRAIAPFASVDHWRVLDRDCRGDDFELRIVLQRILKVLQQRRYEFVCISIGPSLPIEDDDVHMWTSTLDVHLANGKTVLAASCGNSGEYDWESGNARVQPPSDAVNAIGFGAATSNGSDWERAPYSSIGYGRSPGVIKPDLVAFGGSLTEPFFVLGSQRPGHCVGRMGTSYGAPNGLRSGIGMKAHFGDQLSPASTRALMLHHSERGRRNQREIGWGRLPSELSDLVICRDGEVTIVYEGALEPSQFIRFPIPLPRGRLRSAATIKATFCLFGPVDPEDSLSYTRAGLEITFRPITIGPTGTSDSGKPRSAHPSAPFFRSERRYSTESQDRREGYKWEPVYKSTKSSPAGTLDQPVFDVQHHARRNGRSSPRRTDILYGLVVTISAPQEADLYNRILVAYPTQLEALVPTIEIPIRV